MNPGYLALYASGELARRAENARQRLAECRMCPRQCKVNRLEGKKGVCGTGSQVEVASYSPHFGEESPLVGSSGSGTIFISHCNLLCVFCQNYEISHLGEGTKATAAQLASMMISLQRQGCHNINFVTPSHVVPQILAALPIAIEKGLTVPLVYNTSGYDSVTTLQLLEGVFDIYMPDFKFWSPESAKRFAKAPDYPEKAREAIREMHRQVGDLILDERKVAMKGLLVRHLVMPGCLEETADIMRFLASEISPRTYVNVMDQYRPCGRARQYPPIDRQLSREEYDQARKEAEKAGLTRLDRRDWSRIFRHLELF